jgi:penicillin amidase
VLRAAAAVLAAGLVLAAGVAGWAALHLLRSRPRLDGELRLADLSASVRIERDKWGVPSVQAENRDDAAFALGFLHAQDRFFQMDLLRRSAAGELAALVGRAALGFDRELRVHRFRHVARRILPTLPRSRTLDAYARGVNAGLDQLGASPFEYMLLRVQPQAWRPEDTILVVLAMYLDLQSSAAGIESSLGVAYDVLPAPLADFIAARGTQWDAPLRGDAAPAPPLPGAEVYDLRRRAQRQRDAPSWVGLQHEPVVRGSNSWAVAGSLCADGAALLAGDMHLDLRVPNIWYRASLSWSTAGGERWRVTGVTLPGTPVVVSGSNGHVAWAFTNSMVDVSDLVVLQPAGDSGRRYRTTDGIRSLETHLELIEVRGADADTLTVHESVWGPIIDRDHAGRRRAYRWIAHDDEAVNLGLLDMETAGSLEAALAAANRTRIPAQNCIVADERGRIGWTLMGPIPRRYGFDGRLPSSWADGTRGWSGVLAPHEYPRLIDPPHGRLWTANARVLSGELLRRVGDGGYVLGARAQQIRDALFALRRPTARDLLRLQLDNRAVFLERWRALLLDVLARKAGDASSAQHEAPALVEGWGGRAAVESVGYRIVRAFRDAVSDAVLRPLLAPCRELEPRLRAWHFRQREGAVWALVEARPAHLLDRRFEHWEALLSACADSTLARLQALGPLRERTWGERNTSRIRHPLSGAIPLVSRWLDMAPQPLPGDSNMPRVQSPSTGASQRLVVSPGREEMGFFHMPCGQSGHPLSPFYRNSHGAWESGQPTPFLPGATRHTLVLSPG